MPAVTIRNLSEETHRALKCRADLNGNSTEAEIRAILDDAVRPASRIKVGTELAKFGKDFRYELAFERDTRPPEPAEFD